MQESGIEIATPSQSGVYRAVYREATKVREILKQTLDKSKWCLHFDDKIIKKKEHQVVVLKNEVKEVRLAVLVLPDGKFATITAAIHNVLDEYSLWPAIKIIVLDTTNVNTGSKSGVVMNLRSSSLNMVNLRQFLLDASTMYLITYLDTCVTHYLVM